MNAKHGQPAGTVGTITFDTPTNLTQRPAVRDEQGHYWVNLQGALWVHANVRDDQFAAV